MSEVRLKYQRAMDAFKTIHATLNTYEAAIGNFATIVEPKGTRCGSCGWELDQEGQFCAHCGQRWRDAWEDMKDKEEE